jgi:hypothetical protein
VPTSSRQLHILLLQQYQLVRLSHTVLFASSCITCKLSASLLAQLAAVQCSADLAATLCTCTIIVGATNPAARERETAALMQQLAQLSAELAERDTALLHAGEALEDLEQRLAAAERRAIDGGGTTAISAQQQQQQRSGGDHRADAARAAQHTAVLQEEAARYSELEARKNAVEAELEEAEAWKVCVYIVYTVYSSHLIDLTLAKLQQCLVCASVLFCLEVMMQLPACSCTTPCRPFRV